MPKKVTKKPTTHMSELSLPDEVREPLHDLTGFSQLWYGEKKIGKTATAAQLEEAFFLCFEPGVNSQRVYARDIHSWDEARQYNRLLKQDSRFKFVIVDIADIAYEMCLRWVCDKLGIPYPRDDDFGASWKEVKKEWQRWTLELVKMGRGVVFLSHAKFVTVKRRDGASFVTIGPTMGGQGMEVVTGLVDSIAYFGYNGDERVIVVRGNEHIDAGTRLDEHFLTRNGEQILSIPMGNSKEDAYNNYVKAFHNMQREVGEWPLVKPPERKKKGNR